MQAEEPVQAVIWHCLNNYDFKNAVFLAERLCAEFETEDTIFLLATCYYRSKQTQQAFWLLKKHSFQTPRCRYLQARCAYELKEYAAAEYALINNNFGTLNDFIGVSKDFGDISCYVLQLIAQICIKNERIRLAVKALRQALKLNPFMWQAFVELCNMGEYVNPLKTFRITDMALLKKYTSHNLDKESIYQTPKTVFGNVAENNASTPVVDLNTQLKGAGDECEYFKSSTSISPITPCFGVLPTVKEELGLIDKLKQMSFKCNNSGSSTTKAQAATTCELACGNLGSKFNVFTQAGNVPPLSRNLFELPNVTVKKLPTRLNSKLQWSSFETDSLKENKLVFSTNLNLGKWSPRKPKPKCEIAKEISSSTETDEESSTNENEKSKMSGNIGSSNNSTFEQYQVQTADGFIVLLQFLGEGYKLLTKFQSRSAISHFKMYVSVNQRHSSWVQSMIAKAYYELQEYEAAADILKRIHLNEPYRFEYMELYSICLWHIQHTYELTTLAHDLVNCNRLSAITWCVIGNCFSLQNDHEMAITFFKRAIQIDTDFVCAYTLLGDEYMFYEELDMARDYFNAAIAHDSRCYKAWFGIGTTYAKQQKSRIALIYYNKALKINSQNSIILVHIAEMQHALQRNQQAFLSLSIATTLNPNNSLAIFQRAKILYALKHYKEALNVLEELQEKAPNESVIFTLLGNTYKALGKDELALMYFTWAVDKDSKKPELPVKKCSDVLVMPNEWV